MKTRKTVRNVLTTIMVVLLLFLLVGCGTSADDPAARGIEYELSEDGRYYTVVKFTDETNTDVIIPQTYEGRAVRVIGYSAFAECSWIKSISIPNTVKIIEDYAFMGCSGLTELKLPNSLETIGESAFNRCYGITAVEIPARVSYVAESAFWNCDSVEYYAVKSSNKYYTAIDGNLYTKDKTSLIKYAAANKNTAFVLPKTVVNVCTFAFQSCKYIEEVTIPNGVRDLVAIFYNCASLKTVRYEAAVLSASVQYIECPALENFIVDPINPVYQSIDGNLYTKDGTALLRYAPAKKDTSFTVPKSVTMIDSYAFDGAANLETIKVHNDVDSIGNFAFARCSSLKSMDLPTALTAIGESVFEFCTSLERVHISEGISTITGNMFLNCTSLEKVNIPLSVSSVQPAFTGCTSLKKIDYAGMKEDWSMLSMSKGITEDGLAITIVCYDGELVQN